MCSLRLKNSHKHLSSPTVRAMVVLALFIFCSSGTLHAVSDQQKQFASPEEAAKALITAIKANDTNELLVIFGPHGKALLLSGDDVGDRAARARFEKAYEEMNRLEKKDPQRVILHVGKEDWPFHIPIVREGNSWYFNTIEARDEILARRIALGESGTMQACLAFVDAQREYASRDRTGDGVKQYAQKFASEPGKKDGLYWPANEAEGPSPWEPIVAEAIEEGYGRPPSPGQPVSYHGYLFRILKQQGKNAPGGAKNYLANSKMVGGFALVAYPAEYANSGIMTFMVNQDGVVYQKDLGQRTVEIAAAMDSFDPDKTWEKLD